jgi:hypothetical protein
MGRRRMGKGRRRRRRRRRSRQWKRRERGGIWARKWKKGEGRGDGVSCSIFCNSIAYDADVDDGHVVCSQGIVLCGCLCHLERASLASAASWRYLIFVLLNILTTISS